MKIQDECYGCKRYERCWMTEDYAPKRCPLRPKKKPLEEKLLDLKALKELEAMERQQIREELKEGDMNGMY